MRRDHLCYFCEYTIKEEMAKDKVHRRYVFRREPFFFSEKQLLLQLKSAILILSEYFGNSSGRNLPGNIKKEGAEK